jgi:hypothetical protein
MDSTFARQCDDVSSTLSLRAGTLNGATETVSPPRTAPSSFLLALVPTALKQLLFDVQEANLVAPPQNEMPGGWSQFEALLAAAPSSSTNPNETASRLAHPSQGRNWKYLAEVPGQSDATTKNSSIESLAASSCLVTGEL